jgi:aerobic carbon-monoxide dehydrogenase medium subunit
VAGVVVALCRQSHLVSHVEVGSAASRASTAEAARDFLIGESLLGKRQTGREVASEEAECFSDHYASTDHRKHLTKTELARALMSFEEV